MRLEPLYRATFTTPESWSQGGGGAAADRLLHSPGDEERPVRTGPRRRRIELGGENGVEGQSFLIAEGRSEGRLSARLRAANYPRRRTDGTLTPDFRGVLEADDGATILFAWRGYGRKAGDGPRQLVGSVTHLSGDERYRWLNDRICVLAGEVRPREGGGFNVVLEVSELIWEPPRAMSTIPIRRIMGLLPSRWARLVIGLSPGYNGRASMDDEKLLQALRDGDEDAFVTLVDRHHRSMLRLARGFVQARAVAEEVVQETWLAVLEGLDRFEGRSSLRTWIYRILVKRAISRAQREGRSLPFSSVEDAAGAEPAVDPDRFFGPGHRIAGHWSIPPSSWAKIPEDRLVSDETMQLVRRTIDGLPTNQAQVIRLRDVEGWPAEEVCNVMDLSETNQRVLLHRARSKVRQVLERYFDGEGEGVGHPS